MFGTTGQPSLAVPHLFGILSGGGGFLLQVLQEISQQINLLYTRSRWHLTSSVASLSSASLAGTPLVCATVTASASRGSTRTSLFTWGNRAGSILKDLAGSQVYPMFTIGNQHCCISTTVVTTSAVRSQPASRFLFGGQSNITEETAAGSFGNQLVFVPRNQPAVMTMNAS